MSKFVDILGTEIVEGDFVAIGQRSGNSGALSVAIVLETFEDKVRVLGSYRLYQGGFAVNGRFGDTFPDRVIVINSSVPEELQGILWTAHKQYWAKKA